MAAHAARAIRIKHRADSDASDPTDLTSEQRKALEDAFAMADKNGDGVLSVDEYTDIFTAHGLSIDREWIEKTISRHDKDGDGAISFSEFVDMNLRMGRLRLSSASSSASASAAPASSSTTEKARLAFNAYDRNRDGYLTKEEMRKTSKRMTDAQLDAVFGRFDKNKDGKLDFDEFKELMESNKKQ